MRLIILPTYLAWPWATSTQKNWAPAPFRASTRSISFSEVPTETLADGTEASRKEYQASSAVGVSYSQEDEKQDIHIFLITPRGKVEHVLTYGGHPGNARRWAVNTAFDILRRIALEED